MQRIIKFIKLYILAAAHCLYLFTIGILFSKQRLFIRKICVLFDRRNKSIEAIIRYIFAALSCLYLFTIGFLFSKQRPLVHRIRFLFSQRNKLIEPIIPKIELSELVPENGVIQIRQPIGEYENISLLGIVVITKLIKRYNPTNLFEIGTSNGRTTLNMAANCSQEAKVYTLDLTGNKRIIGSRYIGTDCEKKIIQLYGDSATFDYSRFLNSMDFIFIDGSHAYSYVLNDSKQALKLLRNGKGIILWHDYDVDTWEDVARGLNELYLEVSEFKGLKHIMGTSIVGLIVD